jgi:hypothetical protein
VKQLRIFAAMVIDYGYTESTDIRWLNHNIDHSICFPHAHLASDFLIWWESGGESVDILSEG